MTVTKVPERWKSTWDNNLKLAKLLDDAGIDFMLPIARWIGYGGETNFHGSVLETMTWAAGLLAHTSDITVFATIHTAANHPVVVAKQLATIDQISGGRIGLNIVAGWNKPEYEALGLTLPDDHETATAMRRNGSTSSRRCGAGRGLRLGRQVFQAEERARRPAPVDAAADPQRRRLRPGPRIRGPQRRLPVHPGHRPGALDGRDRRAETQGTRPAARSTC